MSRTSWVRMCMITVHLLQSLVISQTVRVAFSFPCAVIRVVCRFERWRSSIVWGISIFEQSMDLAACQWIILQHLRLLPSLPEHIEVRSEPRWSVKIQRDFFGFDWLVRSNTCSCKLCDNGVTVFVLLQLPSCILPQKPRKTPQSQRQRIKEPSPPPSF